PRSKSAPTAASIPQQTPSPDAPGNRRTIQAAPAENSTDPRSRDSSSPARHQWSSDRRSLAPASLLASGGRSHRRPNASLANSETTRLQSVPRSPSAQIRQGRKTESVHESPRGQPR